MRHLNHRFILGRKKEHRTALMANLAAALFRHGRIETTLIKAKALSPFADRIVSMAKEAKLTTNPSRALYLRRLAVARIRDRGAVDVLFDERAGEFLQRNGGYTRIYKLGARRGDAAETALIELVKADDQPYAKTRKKSASKAKAAAEAAPAEAAAEASEASEAPKAE